MPPREFLSRAEIGRRLHYAAWLASALVAFPLLGYSGILLLSLLLGEPVAPALLLGTAGVGGVLAATSVAWRKHGERHGRFREIDDALHAFAHAADAGSHRRRIEDWIAAIARAEGLERQLLRNQAKVWLRAHAHEFDAEERALAAEHLGYLGRG